MRSITEVASRNAFVAAFLSFLSAATRTVLMALRSIERWAVLRSRCISAWRARFFAWTVLATATPIYMVRDYLRSRALCGFLLFLSMAPALVAKRSRRRRHKRPRKYCSFRRRAPIAERAFASGTG